MKVLAVSDREISQIWDNWDTDGRKLLEGVSLIVSAGDLAAEYLEFLVTMACVPCLYVRGNHDSTYDKRAPEGCLDVDGRICEVPVPGSSGLAGRQDTSGRRVIRVAGLGGCMRYRQGSDMYTEEEMAQRVRRLKKKIHRGIFTDVDGREISRLKRAVRFGSAGRSAGGIDIVLTHAPCRGYGDLEDPAHRGFACFNELLEEVRPRVHCYGHIHAEYGRIEREAQHPSGARLINVSGMYLFEI